MPHIHSEAGGHDTTVSAFVFRTDFDQPKLLLHWHRKLNTWLQFGGHVERTENPWQAITHELAEESGYRLPELQLLQPRQRMKKLAGAILHPQPICMMTHEFPGIDHYHSDTAYAFVATADPAGSVQVGESERLQLFTRQELVDLPVDEIIENVREIALFVFDEILDDCDRLPASS